MHCSSPPGYGRRAGWPVVVGVADPRAFAASLVAEVRNIDDPGRIPFESSRSIKAGQSVFVFATVPAGHRLVVQHVSAHVNFQSVLSSSSLLDIFLSAGPGGSSFIPLFLSNSVQFDQPVQLYADAGDLPELSVSVDAGQNRVANGFATLTGYLLDCTAAPCAKIAR